MRQRANKMKSIKYLFDGISVPPAAMAEEAVNEVKRRLKRSGIPLKHADFYIAKKSVDARRKDDIKLIYSVCASFSEISDASKRSKS